VLTRKKHAEIVQEEKQIRACQKRAKNVQKIGARLLLRTNIFAD
jgi:hypothetical protein